MLAHSVEWQPFVFPPRRHPISEHLTVSQLRHATQQMQEWLKDLAGRAPFSDERQAYSLLRAVLHAIRDRLTAEEVAHLGSQLPMIVRGIYFEGWRPALAPNDFTTAEAFLDHVQLSLGGVPQPGLDLADASRTVIDFLSERVDEGSLGHVTAQLPSEIAALFPEPAGVD